ncbi:MAG TPA: (d)CMP kinase [Acidimicrobiia bacterium]|nr:(d)CMP kinase [Acidimicrobiia bacterium]
MSSSLIVTLDGPGGTGKSTVSRLVATRTGMPHLDTGAYYRAVTLAVLEAEVDPSDAEEVARIAEAASLDQEAGHMFLDGRDVSSEIRSQAVTAAVSAVSSHPDVRTRLVALQREWIDRHGRRAVVEGRDIGSVVAPDAEVKVFLDASPRVRAQRRALETGDDEASVLIELNRRDSFDSTRAASPLVVPEGAVVLDTSRLSVEEVVDTVLGLVAARS